MGRKAVTVLPQTQKLLSQMGEQIRLARLRRHISSELVAERANVSRQTVPAIEKGTPSVALGAYAAVLHALGGLEKDLLLIAQDDALGRKLQDLGLPQRQRAPWKTDDGDKNHLRIRKLELNSAGPDGTDLCGDAAGQRKLLL